MSISAKDVKALRDRTGAGMMDCKKALIETDGDIDSAVNLLRAKGAARAAKRAEKSANEGTIGSYIHFDNRTAVIVELNCETDFVAHNADFIALANDLAIHIAAASPRCIGRDDVDQTALEAERHIYREQAIAEGKPEQIIDKIVEGRVGRYLSEVCLLEQPFVKDTDKKVGDMVTEAIGRLGENIVVSRFARFAIGESEATLATIAPSES